jgi:hypothetical protein
MVFCGLELMPYPQTVLFQRVAERTPFASESQVRGRGSTWKLSTTIVVWTRARAGVQSAARAPGETAYAHRASTDAAKQGFERAECRLIPSVSSETPGSPALLALTRQECIHSKPPDLV